MLFRSSTGYDYSGQVLSRAGDLNADGFDDVVIGVPHQDYAAVVYGKAGGFTNIGLGSLDGTNGFLIKGQRESQFGTSIAAGDVNGDGISDLIIGAPFTSGATGAGDPITGRVDVIFGTSSGFPVNYYPPSSYTGGFWINGDYPGNTSPTYPGSFVSAVHDFNGDGIGDILIGQADPAGTSYLIFGTAGQRNFVNLSTLNGTNGFAIHPTSLYYHNLDHGTQLSAADVNHDGYTDLLIGGTNGIVIFGRNGLNQAVTFSADHHTATLPDSDGDTIRVSVSKGYLSAANFTLGATGGLEKLDLHDPSGLFSGANITISVLATRARPAAGTPATDHLVNVGAIDAHGIDLGNVSIAGDLGQIDAGDDTYSTPGLLSLSVHSMGALGSSDQVPGTVNPLFSDIKGRLGNLLVGGDFHQAVINVTGAAYGTIGRVSIYGNLDGTSGFPVGLSDDTNFRISHNLAGVIRATGDIGGVLIRGNVMGEVHSGIQSGGAIGSVFIARNINSTFDSFVISAEGHSHITTQAHSVAIGSLHVGGNVQGLELLAGYNVSRLGANPDASIGSITVGGNWAFSIARAGVTNGPSSTSVPPVAPALIAGDTTTTILARIAQITIRGTITGINNNLGYDGFLAQQLQSLKIGHSTIALHTGADYLKLDSQNTYALDLK